jgi:serine/threonine-protein kinase
VFQGQTALETMMMHVNAPPQLPSSGGGQLIPPDLDRLMQLIPPDLDRLILSCLEKDPADRPRNADQVADILDGCDVGVPQPRCRKTSVT